MAENTKVNVQEVEIPTEAPNVTSGLVVRTIIYLIAIVNAAAAFLGFDLNIPTDYNFIYDGVSLVFFIGSFVHAYWRNNNVRKEARIVEEVAKQLNLKK
ncbi:holin [Bacillus phage 010DV004]|nr:holin [Bacillus phage 010DV004]QZA69354.1 holin [Bacillus phage 010DV005]QZA69922.1 holin [Bacillus phage 043JT007]